MSIRIKQGIAAAIFGSLVLTGANPALSGSPEPTRAAINQPVLTVSTEDGRRPVTAFDRARLEALGMRTLRTTTPWTDGVIEFEGVLLRDILATAATEGAAVRVSALNDFSYTIPMQDLQGYPVILALKMNGQYLSIRNKGPFWVIYPRDDYPELKTKEIEHRMVWQVSRITVQ
jgi:hypothetical protein